MFPPQAYLPGPDLGWALAALILGGFWLYEYLKGRK